jgi:hypothetical protein
MPTVQDILKRIQKAEQLYTETQDLIKKVEAHTGRRLLVYVSDIRKAENSLTPEDKTGFSDLIEGISEEDVDILINSPGGFVEITESIVSMLRSKFRNIRFAIPNMAKSAATLLAFSGDELLLDFRSELGPIDPQIRYQTADGTKIEAAEDILSGFQEVKEILTREGVSVTPAYVPLLNKLTIGLLRSCDNAINLSKRLSELWLRKYMFAKDSDSIKPKEITEFFSSHKETLSHGRAIRIDKCIELGIKIVNIEDPQNIKLLDMLWNLWCLYEVHFSKCAACKVYENSSGCRLQREVAQMFIPVPLPHPPVIPPSTPVPPPKLNPGI